MGRLSGLPPRVASLAPRLGYAPGNERERDRQRSAQQPWRKWYNTARWKALRWTILVRDLFTCQRCRKVEADTSKLVADHRRPHRGDEALFWDEGNLETLCKPCHDGAKQREDKGGGSKV